MCHHFGENFRHRMHWKLSNMIQFIQNHYNGAIVAAMASQNQITDVLVVCSNVCSSTDQRKHRSSASRAFMKGIHRWPVDSPHKGPVTRKMFPFDDAILYFSRTWSRMKTLWYGNADPHSLLWSHNGRDGVSNNQPQDCLLNRLFGRRSKKSSKLRVIGIYAGNSPGLVNSQHKWPVMRKMFPFHDVILGPMKTHRTLQINQIREIWSLDYYGISMLKSMLVPLDLPWHLIGWRLCHGSNFF